MADDATAPDELIGEREQDTLALRAEVGHLRRALVNRDLIGMAKGVVIAERQCSPDEAFDFLVRLSQTKNRKLIDIAAEVVATAGGGALAPPEQQ